MTEATERRLGLATDLDYDMHPARECADGVTLYIRHGLICAMVTHADGSNSNASFNQRGLRGVEWRTDWRRPTARQSRALDAIAHALQGVTVEIGATAHHLILHGAAELSPATRRMLVRRLGLAAPRIGRVITLELNSGKLDGSAWLDTVTDVGARIRFVVDGETRQL